MLYVARIAGGRLILWQQADGEKDDVASRRRARIITCTSRRSEAPPGWTPSFRKNRWIRGACQTVPAR